MKWKEGDNWFSKKMILLLKGLAYIFTQPLYSDLNES